MSSIQANRASLAQKLVALGGLSSVELRSALPVTFGLVFAAAVALGACRFSFDVVLPAGGIEQVAMIVALMAAVALPLTAELLEADWRRGTARTLQGLPVSQAQLLGAKLFAGLIALAAGFLVLWLVDCCLVAAEPSPNYGVLSALDVTGVLSSPAFVPVTLVLAWIGVIATGLVAVVFRHALGATLIGGLVALGPLAVPYAMTSGASAPDWLVGMAYGIVHHPLLFVTLLVSLTLLVPIGFKLRGVRSRSAPRRFLVVLLSAAGFSALVIGGQVVKWRLAAAPSFDDPTGDPNPLRFDAVSPDGAWAVIDMTHGGGLSRRSALWLVDGQTLEVEALPDVNGELGSWLPYRVGAGSFSWDGQEILGHVQKDQEGMSYQFYAIDVASRRVREVDYDELHRRVTYADWTFEGAMSREPDPKKRFIEARRGDVQVTLNSWRRPAVPVLAPHLLFYTNGDGRVTRFDSQTGEHRDLGLDNWTENDVRVSPDGAWLTVFRNSKARKGPLLLEVDTGRTKEVKSAWFQSVGGQYPIFLCSDRKLSQWTRAGLDDEITFTTEVPVDSMVPFGASRWLGRNVNGGVFVFDLDGSLVKTLREPRPEVKP